MKTYYAPGKIMLCGEYAVTCGLEAFALPVKAGQWLRVWETETLGNSKIHVQSFNETGNAWFTAKIDPDIFHVVEATDPEVAKVLVKMLRVIDAERPAYFQHKELRLEFSRDFPAEWGLGSSSTMVSLLSQWSNTDPFQMQHEVFGGSGYDVAASVLRQPLKYWLENNQPNWEPWNISPEITQNWKICFPGEKVNSRQSLHDYRHGLEQLGNDPMLQQQLNMILSGFHEVNNKAMAEAGLEMWQAMLSNILGIPRVYDDLEIKPVKGGLCKWCGAWGGDMILVNDVILDAYPVLFSPWEKLNWNDFVITQQADDQR